MKRAGIGIALAIVACHCAGAREAGDKPSAVLRTWIVLEPSGAGFCLPDHWLRRYRRSRNNIYLTRQELERARSASGEWDSQFSAVVNTVLPFENCAVHVGAEGWGRNAVSFDDLQMRAYVGEWEPGEVRKLVREKGLPTARILSARSRPPPRKEASASSRQAGPWQVDALAFDLFFGDYGGTAAVDFYTRRFGDSTAVLVFMYVDRRRSKPTIPGQITTIVESFSWPAGPAHGPARPEAIAPSKQEPTIDPRRGRAPPPASPGAADARASLPADPLGDVMWRVLPDRIRSVSVGPDGRTWLELRHYGPQETAAARANIEAEFHKPMPRISGYQPVLFEPGGRAWFRSGNRRLLLGYDGRRWVEYKADWPRFLTGNCANHGRSGRQGFNAFMMGRAFFIGSRGMHCFDGESWSYHAFSEEGYRRTELWPEPDRRGLVALTHHRTESALWRWREREWTRLREFVGDYAVRPSSAAPGVSAGREGVWLLYRSGDLRFLPFGRVGGPDGPKPAPLEGYKVAKAFLLHYDAGDVIVGAGEISKGQRKLGPGVLICEADGKARMLECDGLSEARENYYMCSGPIVLRKDGRISGVWFDGSPNGRAPRLLNVASPGPLKVVPDPRFHWLHAVLPDGAVVAGVRDVFQPGSTLAIYRPGKPDDRRVLATRRMQTRLGTFCVSPDGSVWTETPEEGVVRFDGTGWRPVPALREWRDVSFFLPGSNGEMLLGRGELGTRDGEFGFLSGDEFVVDASLPDLIQEHRERMVKAFSGRARKNPWDKDLEIVADSSGNIWLIYWRNLRVLIGGEWQRAGRALSDDGSRSGRAEYVAALGAGNKVYVSDLGHDHGTSFYGQVLDGTLVFDPAPHTADHTRIRRTVIDDTGALWVPVQSSRQVVKRINESGLVQEIRESGWPRLCDAGGNVWLGNIRGKPPYRLTVWSRGKLVHALDVPGAEAYRTRMFSDKPGSVFVWTSAGLSHLKVGEPGDASTFALDAIYFPENVRGHFTKCQYSKLGYAAVGTYVDRADSRQYFLHLISLP